MTVDTTRLRATAIHEAGHAVISTALGLYCWNVTIVPKDDALGYAEYANPLLGWQRGDGPRRPLVEAYCMATMAGAEAEHIVLGTGSTGDLGDLRQIDWTLGHVRIRGCRYLGDEAWQAYTDRLRARTRLLVVQHAKTIAAMADALIARKTLSGAEIEAFCGVGAS